MDELPEQDLEDEELKSFLTDGCAVIKFLEWL